MALFGLSLPDGRGRVGGPDDEYVAALHPDHRHLAAGFRELADRQDAFPAAYWIVRADGSALWLEGRGLVISRMPDGRAHRLVSIMADATERKRAEQRLLVEHQRLELALGAGRMGAYDMDMRDNVLWWSAQTYRLFGVSEQDFVPTPAHVLALLHPDDREGFVRARAEAIQGHRPFVHEFRILRPDGTQAWLGHRGHVEYDAGGGPVRIFGVTMDITERKLVETRLQDADQQKDRFIAMLAHELRNPLAPIRNAVAVLRRIGGGDATSAWCHDVIDRQVSQMAHLLDDLLDASRLSHGHLRLRMQPLQLATAIDRAIEIAKPVIDAGGHSFSCHLPARPFELDGDLTRLAQVFSNILINAAKYTPRGGAISLTIERENRQALVRVTDTGIGIEPHHRERIFEMFGQVESSLARAQGGQGIGLALAKALVEMHGGTIAATSEGLGKGSRFEVRLPLAFEAAEAPQEAAGTRDSSAAVGRRVLVVDDMRDSADSLALAVQALGYEVEVAYGGAAALRRVEAARPDIVLLDLGMPEVDGYEVCRRIRAAPWGHDILLIAQTGWGNANDRELTRQAGFDHHLVKPVELGALASLLESASPASR
jgi:PAS domain S-box-containing protein